MNSSSDQTQHFEIIEQPLTQWAFFVTLTSYTSEVILTFACNFTAHSDNNYESSIPIAAHHQKKSLREPNQEIKEKDKTDLVKSVKQKQNTVSKKILWLKESNTVM